LSFVLLAALVVMLVAARACHAGESAGVMLQRRELQQDPDDGPADDDRDDDDDERDEEEDEEDEDTTFDFTSEFEEVKNDFEEEVEEEKPFVMPGAQLDEVNFEEEKKEKKEKKKKESGKRKRIGTSFSSSPAASASSVGSLASLIAGSVPSIEAVEEEPYYESYEVPQEQAPVVREDGGVCAAGCDSCVAVAGAEECCGIKDSDCQRCAEGETEQWPCTSDNIFRCRCEMKADDMLDTCTSECDTCTASPDAMAEFGITDEDCAPCADGAGDGEEPLAWPCGPDDWMAQQNTCLCQTKASNNGCTSECDTCTASPDAMAEFGITDEDCARCADGAGEEAGFPCGPDEWMETAGLCSCAMKEESSGEMDDLSVEVLRFGGE